jgi:phage recombination protein Bet
LDNLENLMNNVANIDSKPQQGKLLTRMAKRVNLAPGDEQKLYQALTSVAFRTRNGQPPSREQMLALMIVADRHNLDPFTKEIHAFEDGRGGIVPVVGVDGWARIINEHPEFDGMEFKQDDESCTCTMYRKDRSHPTSVTEYLAECMRPTGPWKSHPRRMLRHKAMIQCARVAFAFAGIYDPDEAEAIVETDITQKSPEPRANEPSPGLPGDELARILEPLQQQFADGDMGADEVIAMLESRYTLTDAQRHEIQTYVADLAPIDTQEPHEPVTVENEA